MSLLSDNGMAIEEISRLVGHSSTNVTETVYRHELRPVLQYGAEVMDDLFSSVASQRIAAGKSQEDSAPARQQYRGSGFHSLERLLSQVRLHAGPRRSWSETA